jgi:hypothetical protein
MKFINATLSATAIAATLLSPAHAVQAPPTVKTAVSSHANQLIVYKSNWNNTLRTSLQTWDVSTKAGEKFLALCIEPGQSAITGTQDYSVGTGFSFGAKSASVDRLYGLFYSSAATDTATSLSFQLALWELYNDDGSLSKGTLQFDAAQNTGTRAGAVSIASTASLMLADVAAEKAYTTKYTYTQYSSDTLQNFVTAKAVSAVPEPATYAMLGLGLALVGFTARRKSKR